MELERCSTQLYDGDEIYGRRWSRNCEGHVKTHALYVFGVAFVESGPHFGCCDAISIQQPQTFELFFLFIIDRIHDRDAQHPHSGLIIISPRRSQWSVFNFLMEIPPEPTEDLKHY